MTGLPKLADVQCTRLQFQPGDRILVKVYQPLGRDQRKKLRRTVEKWAGTDVEVLIVDATAFDVQIEKKGVI